MVFELMDMLLTLFFASHSTLIHRVLFISKETEKEVKEVPKKAYLVVGQVFSTSLEPALELFQSDQIQWPCPTWAPAVLQLIMQQKWHLLEKSTEKKQKNHKSLSILFFIRKNK